MLPGDQFVLAVNDRPDVTFAKEVDAVCAFKAVCKYSRAFVVPEPWIRSTGVVGYLRKPIRSCRLENDGYAILLLERRPPAQD